MVSIVVQVSPITLQVKVNNMKEHEVYQKYANMPLVKRSIEVDIGLDQNGTMRSYSPHFIYTELNRLSNIRRENEQAIKDLLVIAEKVIT